jgi:hypothetical protein
MKVTKPKCCVEVGVFEGFSAIVMGHTLKELRQDEKGMVGKLFAYDLFELYPYTNAKYTDVKQRINRFGLNEFIELRQKDLFEAENDFGYNSIDFMHVDVSNTGETIRNVIDSWDNKIRPGGILLFEGGSPLRDEVSWMKKYNKDKISTEVNSNHTLKTKYTSLVMHPYPSMVICCKKIQFCQQTWEEFGYDRSNSANRHGEIDETELIRILSLNKNIT